MIFSSVRINTWFNALFLRGQFFWLVSEFGYIQEVAWWEVQFPCFLFHWAWHERSLANGHERMRKVLELQSCNLKAARYKRPGPTWFVGTRDLLPTTDGGRSPLQRASCLLIFLVLTNQCQSLKLLLPKKTVDWKGSRCMDSFCKTWQSTSSKSRDIFSGNQFVQEELWTWKMEADSGKNGNQRGGFCLLL